MDLAPDQVDIVDFQDRAKALLDNSHSVRDLSEESLDTLLNEARHLDAMWTSDPAEAFRDDPRVAALFEPFKSLRDRLLEKLAELVRAAQSREPGDQSSSTPLVGEYLSDVLRRGLPLAFGNPTSWAASAASDDFITLDDLWAPLRVADSRERSGDIGTHESMAERNLGTDLLSLVDSTDQPLIVLGEPGSGKSTSVAMLAAQAARRGSSAPLPIWVNLGAVIPNPRLSAEAVLLTGVPEIDVAIGRHGRHAGVTLSLVLESALSNGRALLLLDGLDEVKEHALDAVRKAVSAVSNLDNGSRIIVTCRSFDYRQSEPNRKVPIGRELELLPLNPEEKDAYVSRWYGAAARAGGFAPALAQKLCAALQRELRNSPVISDMADLPLLLALLTLIHSRQELPDSRSVVCDQAIKFMLAETPPWRERDPGTAIEASGPIVRLAVEVAFRCHASEERASDADEAITHDLIREEAAKIVGALERAGADRSAPNVEELSSQFENSHGLLLELGPNRYRFAHRYFQEFLAGQHYSRGRDYQQAVHNGGFVHWREPFRLMASFAGHDGNNLPTILQLVQDLLASESVAAKQLAAEMLVEISRPRLALWGFEDVLDLGDSEGRGQGLWELARTILANEVEDLRLTLPARERAGDALAFLGDPRFVESSGEIRGAWVHQVDVRAGERQIGTMRLDQKETTGGFVGPPRKLVFPFFRIGRYPVTNADFSAFVAGDGYQNPEYWPSRRALGWVQGDKQALREIREHWLATVHEHHAKEIRDGEIQADRLEIEAERRTAPRLSPYYWDDSRFNRFNQPVVGINFWEAEAYCYWATARAHERGELAANEAIVLPTEFEWERAARPVDDDRIYPWGDIWDEERALVTTNTLNLRAPATVGVHLEPWAGGPLDLAGNVWEWTASLFLPYADKHDPNRLDSDSLEERVVRGGSWYHFSPLAASSARAVDRSYNLFYDVGFRVAIIDQTVSRAGST